MSGSKIKYIPISVDLLFNWPAENEVLYRVGHIAGECYGSDRSVVACMKRAIQCIRNGHHTPFEHVVLTLTATIDRGTSHALVRHRHCSFMQSSTIYQKFNDCMCIIKPDDLQEDEIKSYEKAYKVYKKMLENKIAPSRARDVLPTSLATNLIITTNFREWIYILKRRGKAGDSANMATFVNETSKLFVEHYPDIVFEFDRFYKNHPL